jgi:hypothetical protein
VCYLYELVADGDACESMSTNDVGRVRAMGGDYVITSLCSPVLVGTYY